MNISLKDAIEQNGQILHFTKGISMQPMLKQGENPVIVGKLSRKLKKRDVILFDGGNDRCVLHRIIKIKDGKYLARGDNNLFNDGYIKHEDVLGVLYGYYKGEKYIDCKKNFRYRVYSFFIPMRYHLRILKRKLSRFVPRFIKRLIRKIVK